MAPTTTEHSPHDHDEYSHQPNTVAQFPDVPPDNFISSILLFDFFMHTYFLSDDWRSRMATLYLGLGLLKFTSDTNTDTATTPRKSHFCERRNISTTNATDSNNSLSVMRQVQEETQNQNHILREQISSLSEHEIRKAHSCRNMSRHELMAVHTLDWRIWLWRSKPMPRYKT